MKSLFFAARHGATFLNDSNMFRGWSNGPDAQLNSDGRKSAHEQGIFLAGLGQKFSKIICSPLGRAQLTAAIIAGYIGIEKIQIDERLRPLNVGSLAGQPKDQNPIGLYLKDKSKKFPDGESVNDFEARQSSFTRDLLDIIEAGKQEDDVEVLVVAHVSNLMFFWNLQSGKSRDEYLDESEDIVLPGGLAIITENSTIPIFRANEQAHSEGEGIGLINSKAVKGEPGTGYEPEGGKGLFQCGNCEYFRASDSACGQEDMKKKSKLPHVSDGFIKVEAAGCCEYVERPNKK